MREAANRHLNWVGLPLIATIARLLCRELTLQNEYLRQENTILKSRIKGRIRFDDDERRSRQSPGPAPRRAPALNRGPFPPPALPGFTGTTGLSAPPNGPACPSRAAGSRARPPTAGASRVALHLRVRAGRRHYPGGTAESFALPVQRRRPSPKLGWVGSRIMSFEACSAFTRVTACSLAESPCDPLHRRLRLLRYLGNHSDCYWPERQRPGGNSTR